MRRSVPEATAGIADCLAARAYRLLLRRAVRGGQLAPELSGKAADRGLADLLEVSPSTLRNWRRCRARTPQARLLERGRGLLPAGGSDDEDDELTLLQQLVGAIKDVARAAEALVAELQHYTLDGGWHLYEGPLYLAFHPRLATGRRASLMARSEALLDAILDRQLTEQAVPALPELIRYSVHGWHHASSFDVRRRSVQQRVAHVGSGYLDRIELALYLGDACAMPALFAGTPRSAVPFTRRALALLAEAGPDDERASPVSIRDARTMVRAVEAQIMACHGSGQEALEALARFERLEGGAAPEVAWIDSVRLGALGYIALTVRGDAAAAAEAFSGAEACVDGWLARAGIPFGSTSHSALAGYALAVDGQLDRASTTAQEALLRALEHNVIVDEVAGRTVLARLSLLRGDRDRSLYHRTRGDTLVATHRLDAWRAALDRLVQA